MAGDRMRRMWSPSTGGTALPLAAGNSLESDIAPSTTLQLSLDRTPRDWTIARIIGNIQFATQTAAPNEANMYVGIRVANENEPHFMINPGIDQTADWMFWEGLVISSLFAEPANALSIDNRSQRKSRGEESKLRLYIFNGGPYDVYCWFSLRVLMLTE